MCHCGSDCQTKARYRPRLRLLLAGTKVIVAGHIFRVYELRTDGSLDGMRHPEFLYEEDAVKYIEKYGYNNKTYVVHEV